MRQTLKKMFSICFIAIMLIFSLLKIGECQTSNSLYYARYYMETANGIITKTDLELIPIHDEYRAENFEIIRVTGISDNESSMDGKSDAIHDAIAKILVHHGLKSIKSRQRSSQGQLDDITIMNYEGAIRDSFHILRKGYTKDGSDFYVEMDIEFAPLAFPTKWSTLYFKHTLHTYLFQLFKIFI